MFVPINMLSDSFIALIETYINYHSSLYTIIIHLYYLYLLFIYIHDYYFFINKAICQREEYLQRNEVR